MDLSCRWCKDKPETQDHILKDCPLFTDHTQQRDMSEIMNPQRSMKKPEATIIVYLPGYFTVHTPPPAPSGPKFFNSENCCGSENVMPPKIFWDMEGHRGNFR